MTKYTKMAYFVLVIVISCMSWIVIFSLMGFSFMILLPACILAGMLANGDRAAKIYTAFVIFSLTTLIWAILWGLPYIYPSTGGIFVAKLYDWFGNHGDLFAALMSVIVGIPLGIVALRMLANIHEKSSRYFAVSLAAFITIFPITWASSAALDAYAVVIFTSVPYIVSAILAALVGSVRRPHQDIILWLTVSLVLILVIPVPTAEA